MVMHGKTVTHATSIMTAMRFMTPLTVKLSCGNLQRVKFSTTNSSSVLPIQAQYLSYLDRMFWIEKHASDPAMNVATSPSRSTNSLPSALDIQNFVPLGMRAPRLTSVKPTASSRG